MTNRIEDLIEKARHYQDLWHEALDENKRLEEEVERLNDLIIRGASVPDARPVA